MDIKTKFSIGQTVYVLDVKTGEAYKRCVILEIKDITICSDGLIMYNALYGIYEPYGYFYESDAFATEQDALAELDKYDGMETIATYEQI